MESDASTKSSSEHWWHLAQAFLIILAITFRFLNLNADIPLLQNADDLGDEGYWFSPSRDLLLFGELDKSSNFKQALAGAPLSLLTLALSGKIFGSLDFASMRAVSAFYSSLILLLAFFYFSIFKKRQFASTVFIVLYGLFPLTLFYSRICHLEQHLLFYIFLGFILLETAKKPRGFFLAGFVASVSLLVKAVSVLALPAFPIYLLVRYKKESLRPLASFTLGVLPIAVGYAIYLFVNQEAFAPTMEALASSHRQSGFFIDSFSIDYFWTRPLVLVYLPWLFIGLLCYLGTQFKKRSECWGLIWLVTVLVVLSITRYQSFARHQLLFFPLLLVTAFGIDGLFEKIGHRALRLSIFTLVLLGLSSGVYFGTYKIGEKVFLNPVHSHEGAAKQLALVTTEEDSVSGVHNHSLSLYGRYKTRMNVKASAWKEVDPLPERKPTVMLVAKSYNGVAKTPKQFPSLRDLPYFTLLSRIRYLQRFDLEIYRSFWSKEAFDDFMHFRSGRASKYDGVLYNLYKNNRESGCLVKALQVAESRGDREISHLKISGTGCAGMMGFCYQTALDPLFHNIFKTVLKGVHPRKNNREAFLKDDRFKPKQSFLAAERYIRTLLDKFSAYPNKYEFAFASYNGGPGFVSHLIDLSGKPKPNFETDIMPLLFAENVSSYPLYGKWPLERRKHKLQVEIPLYVQDASDAFHSCYDLLN